MIHRYRKLTNFLFHENTKQLPLRKYVRPIYYFLESVIIYPILQRIRKNFIDSSPRKPPNRSLSISLPEENRHKFGGDRNSTRKFIALEFDVRVSHATFSDIFHKIQMTGQEGRGGREERRWMAPSNRNSYRWCYETYKYFARWWWHRYDCSFNLDRESPPLRVL